MPLGTLDGMTLGARADFEARIASIFPCKAWLGRVIDAFGNPTDGKGPLPQGSIPYALKASPPKAQDRGRVGGKLDLGVRALNAFVTCCKGQRMGIFAGSGVGKSTLLAMLARNTDADAIVIGLVGERGREVKEFIEDDLGEEGLKRSVDRRRNLRRAAAGAPPSGLCRHDGGRTAAGPRLACAAPDGQRHSFRNGTARSRPLRRRAADVERLYADRVRRIAALAGTRGSRRHELQRFDHGSVHGSGGRRRP